MYVCVWVFFYLLCLHIFFSFPSENGIVREKENLFSTHLYEKDNPILKYIQIREE